MRLGIVTLFALGAVALGAGATAAQEQMPTTSHPLPRGDAAKLAWLEGCWTGEKDGIVSMEQWSSPSGGGLVGMHKDTKGGRMSGYEFFRIARDSSGQLTYFSSPGGRPPTPFRIIDQSASKVSFANMEHDFPQLVSYWLAGDALHAKIEGTLRGEEMSEEWVWRRCPR